MIARVTITVFLLLSGCGGAAPPAAGRATSTENRPVPAPSSPLSDATLRVLGELDTDVEIVAYVDEDLPAPHDEVRPRLEELLAAYDEAGGDHVVARLATPGVDASEQTMEEDLGIPLVQLQRIENDSVSVVARHLGLLVRRRGGSAGEEFLGEPAHRGARSVLPVIQNADGLEYEITRRILQVTRPPVQVGVVEGHGSSAPGRSLTKLQRALPHYEVRAVNVGAPLGNDLRALLAVDATEPFTEQELRHIDDFVRRGGSLGVFGGAMRVDMDGTTPTARPSTGGLDRLLAAWGIRMERALVADARCGRVPLRTSTGVMLPVAYPPAPIASGPDVPHPVFVGVESTPFFFASPLTTEPGFADVGRVLARSSELDSWLLRGDRIDLAPRQPRDWDTGSDEGPFALLVALEGRLPSAFRDGARADRPARVLVSGSASMVQDTFLPDRPAGAAPSGGLAVAVQAVEWLTEDSALLALRR